MVDRAPSAFAALHYRDYALFWTANTVSNVGTAMQQFALGLLVVDLAAREGRPELSAFYLGVIGLARAIPGLLLGLLGGVIADRFEYRRLLAATQTTAGLVAAGLAVLVYTDTAHIAWVAALNAVLSAAFAVDAPTRQAMNARIVPTRVLASAIGLNSASFNGGLLLGPLLAGALVIPFGIGGLFVIKAVTYLGVDLALLFMKPHPLAEGARSLTILGSLREGVAFIARDPVVRWLVCIGGITAIFGRQSTALMPAIATSMLDQGALGLSWLLAAQGGGALAGALGTAALGTPRHRGLVLVGGLFALGALLVVFSAQSNLWLSLVLVFGLGFAELLFIGMQSTLTQTLTPARLRGRVISVQAMTFQGALPLGTLLLGSTGSFVGLPVALFLGGVGTLVVGATVAVLAPAVRRAGVSG